MRSFKVAEVFGPTVQGEGPDIGRPCYFIRLGGCDYRCTWCDSMHAVRPELVRQLPDKTEEQILEDLLALPSGGKTVVLSGGNPALWDLSGLIFKLKELGFRVTCETQGTKYQTWFDLLDLLVISPKPPSAIGWDKAVKDTDPDTMFDKLHRYNNACVKVPILNAPDLEWVSALVEDHFLDQIYLSVVTLPTDSRDDLLDRYHWLIESCKIMFAESDCEVIVLPQMHVLVWGHKLGV